MVDSVISDIFTSSSNVWLVHKFCVITRSLVKYCSHHYDVIKWKRFQRYWPFVRGIHRSPMNSPHKGQWRRALMFSLNYAWTNDWENTPDAGDLRRHRAHYDLNVMTRSCIWYVSVIHNVFTIYMYVHVAWYFIGLFSGTECNFPLYTFYSEDAYHAHHTWWMRTEKTCPLWIYERDNLCANEDNSSPA